MQWRGLAVLENIRIAIQWSIPPQPLFLSEFVRCKISWGEATSLPHTSFSIFQDFSHRSDLSIEELDMPRFDLANQVFWQGHRNQVNWWRLPWTFRYWFGSSLVVSRTLCLSICSNLRWSLWQVQQDLPVHFQDLICFFQSLGANAFKVHHHLKKDCHRMKSSCCFPQSWGFISFSWIYLTQVLSHIHSLIYFG